MQKHSVTTNRNSLGSKVTLFQFKNTAFDKTLKVVQVLLSVIYLKNKTPLSRYTHLSSI